jgi:hypothetical protein
MVSKSKKRTRGWIWATVFRLAFECSTNWATQASGWTELNEKKYFYKIIRYILFISKNIFYWLVKINLIWLHLVSINKNINKKDPWVDLSHRLSKTISNALLLSYMGNHNQINRLTNKNLVYILYLISTLIND